MKIFNNTTIPKNYKGAAIAIGNFDGIHKGHQKIFIILVLKEIIVYSKGMK